MTIHMPFGKWRNTPVAEVPSDYLMWVLREVASLEPYLRTAIVEELQARGTQAGAGRSARGRQHRRDAGHARPPGPTPPPGGAVVDVKRAVDAWYRELVLRYHPDRNGSHEVMVALNDAYDRLRKALQIAN